MDNLTHTLTAIAISHTGLNRKTRFATGTLILAANAPDFDIVMGLKSSIAYLHYHRGITHTFIGISLIAVAIWGLMYWIGTKVRPKPGIPLAGRWLLLAAFLGTGSHLLLDFTNAYGVRPLLPFSGQWFAWDIMPIIDPVLLGILVLGLALPWLLRLVSEEVGARKSRTAPGAIFCLAALVAVWMVRDFSHRRALSILDSRTYSGENPLRLSALPMTTNPFRWIGVVETETAFHAMGVNSLDANSAPEEFDRFEKPQPSAALSAAMATPNARIFLGFARFPWAETEESDQGYQVTLRDLRFFHPAAPSATFTLIVDLDKNLSAHSAVFYFNAPPGVGNRE